MAEVYLRPEDVRPADAQKVLDFLNAAESAQQIADAVEFAGELDVGLRVAQRILDRRAALGRFSKLAEIAAVPLVGPERFSEIVRALAGLAPPAQEDGEDLRREVRALRAMVEALLQGGGPGPRITLRPTRDELFLGQPVTIVARLADARDRPMVDVPVVFATTWGRVRSADGYGSDQGSSVSARTGIDGSIRVTLLPPSAEDLWDIQQSALEAMLQLLDAGAETPRGIEQGLRELGRQYRWEANVDFRRAVDIYFRDFGRNRLETVNVRDYMQSWHYFDALISAFVPGSVEGGTVAASAVLRMRFKDWLGPWLEAYLTLSEQENSLSDELSRAKQRGGSAGVLTDRVYRRVRDYVRSQRGLAGEYVGRRVAETSLQNFLQTGLADLQPTTRAAMFPALDLASRAVVSSGANVVAAVGQARTDLRQELDTGIARVETERIAPLSQRVTNVQAAIDGKVSVAHFEGYRQSVDTRLAAKIDADQLDRTITRRLDERLGQRLTDMVDAQVAVALDRQLPPLLQERVADEVDVRIDRVLEAKLDPLVTQRIDAALAGKVDRLELERLRQQVDQSLAGKVDTSTFNGFREQVNTSLTTKIDRIQLDNALRTKLDVSTFDNRIGSLQDSVNGLNVRIRDINR